jgi:hypothetical protein
MSSNRMWPVYLFQQTLADWYFFHYTTGFTSNEQQHADRARSNQRLVMLAGGLQLH